MAKSISEPQQQHKSDNEASPKKGNAGTDSGHLDSQRRMILSQIPLYPLNDTTNRWHSDPVVRSTVTSQEHGPGFKSTWQIENPGAFLLSA